MIVCGIDPGAKGGLAAVNSWSGKLSNYHRMPLNHASKKPTVNPRTVRELLVDCWDVRVIVLEQVHSMPKQGVASSFQFGRMYGAIEAACMMSGVALFYVTPQVWKKHHNLGPNKRASLDKAAVLYPGACDWSVLANEGIAEAALIAQWWINTRHG